MSRGEIVGKPDPWRVPLAVEQIPVTGLHRDLVADQATRVAVADVGGLREVLSVQASLDVTPGIHQRQYEFFVQDNYRWKSNVTINIGARYSNFRQPYTRLYFSDFLSHTFHIA